MDNARWRPDVATLGTAAELTLQCVGSNSLRTFVIRFYYELTAPYLHRRFFVGGLASTRVWRRIQNEKAKRSFYCGGRFKPLADVPGSESTSEDAEL